MRVWPRALVALVTSVVLACPGTARALAPPVPGAVLLAFGATYGDAGSPRTHRGLDLACPAGDEVRAPAAGTVAFVGRVPADGGGTLVAATVVMDDGLRLTLLPLGRASVSAGVRVDEGEPLGEAAGEGDASSSEPHIHLSARRGELYVDPAPLLTLAAPVPAPSLTEAGAEEAAAPPAPPASERLVRTQAEVADVRPGAGEPAAATRRETADPRPAALEPVAPAQAHAARPAPTPAEALSPDRVDPTRTTDTSTAWVLAAAAAACVTVALGLRAISPAVRPGESEAM